MFAHDLENVDVYRHIIALNLDCLEEVISDMYTEKPDAETFKALVVIRNQDKVTITLL